MSGLSSLTIEELVDRIERTNTGTLRGAARLFETAADGFGQVRAQMNGVVGDTSSMWDSRAGAAFAAHSGQVLRGLADVEATLRQLSAHLRAHADVTDEAKAGLAPSRTKRPYHPSAMDQVLKQHALERHAVSAFHESERQVRAALWARGEQAPGPLPVPVIPPPPELPWWLSLLFGEGPVPSWVTEDGDPWGGPRRPYPSGAFGQGQPYGYDEDGNLVPAHRAAYPSQVALNLEAGVLRGILQRITGAGKAGTSGSLVGEVMEVVSRSPRWQDGHLDRYIRQFYGLPEGDGISGAARAQFMEVVEAALEKSGRVFRWELPPQGGTVGEPTYAVLHRDPKTRQWLVVQFYQEGDKAGQFATAFRPPVSELNQMLQKNALAEGVHTGVTPLGRVDTHLAIRDAASGYGLTPAEREAVYEYTLFDYGLYNGHLRNGIVLSPDAQSSLERGIEALSLGLGKLPKHEGVVYRGAMLEPKQVAQYQPGRLVQEKAFTSSSIDPAEAFSGNVRFTIVSRNGRNISSVSAIPEESEVLFDRGAWFMVLRKDVDPSTGAVNIVMLEVVR